MMKRCFSFISFLLILSCGKENFPDYKEKEVSLPMEGNLRSRGSFKPLNQSRLRGTYLTWIMDNQIYFDLLIKHAPRRMRIQQYVHKGSKCPGAYSDLNGDGKIDYGEVLISSGEMLIPLDRKLNHQLEGSDWFPVSDEEGSYSYSKAGSVGFLVQDLKNPDEAVHDSLGMLFPGEDLDLSERTIVLYGNGKDPLFPIACAEL